MADPQGLLLTFCGNLRKERWAPPPRPFTWQPWVLSLGDTPSCLATELSLLARLVQTFPLTFDDVDGDLTERISVWGEMLAPVGSEGGHSLCPRLTLPQKGEVLTTCGQSQGHRLGRVFQEQRPCMMAVTGVCGLSPSLVSVRPKQQVPSARP